MNPCLTGRIGILRFAVCLLIAAALVAAAGSVHAAPGDVEANRGLAAAKRGDCVKATPLLEEAELKRHRPHTALALANCYVALGELLRASALFHATADEPPRSRGFTWYDRLSIRKAKKRAADVDKRIPTLAFEPDAVYDGLEVEIDGKPVNDIETPRQVPPDIKLTITARAEGMEEITEELLLAEGERHVFKLRLSPLPPPPKKPKRPPKPPPDGRPTTWIGAGFRGYVIPKFVFGMVGEGGRSVFVPGGDLTLTTRTSDVDVTISAAYASFRLVETPFKPAERPDTDYEIIESDLQALMAAIHLTWDVPLDQAGTFSFRVGGGVGVGWTFLGNLYRTQAYPPKGAGRNPYLYKKCAGPNDPQGSFKYCNQLDYDADHYFGYVEPSWFDGGYSPLIFPWLAVPELGLTAHPTRSVAIDLQVGLSLTGLMTALGVRFGL